MPFEERKQREKEERRNEIIDAAEKLFFSKGYDAVRMDDIAKEVKVNKALLYYYFNDKDTLYMAVAVRGARIFNAMAREAAASETTGIKKLRAIGRMYFDFSLKYPGYYQVDFEFNSHRFLQQKRELFPECRELSLELARLCTEAAQLGLEDGTIRSSLKPIEVVTFLALACEGLVKAKYMAGNLEYHGVSFEQFIEDSLDMLNHAIKSPDNR